MPDEAVPEPFERRLRRSLRTYRGIVSDIILAIGLVLIVLALGDFTPLSKVAPFPTIDQSTVQPTVDYNLAFIIIGPIITIVGAYLVGAYTHARRRFEHLMLTKSKAEFLRNIPEIEDLLWDLTPEDESRYQVRLSELRLRR